MWISILAQDDGYGTELIYVIALLILSGIGALAEKLKQKKQQQQESRRYWKPSKIDRPERPAQHAPSRQVRPAPRREPTAPVAAPPARPVQRKVDVPRPPAQARPRPQVPAERQRQPTVRRRKATPRGVPEPRPPRSPSIEPGRAEQPRPAGIPAAPPRPGPGLFTPVRPKHRLGIGELRRAIVLSEVLRPPLALRDFEGPN